MASYDQKGIVSWRYSCRAFHIVTQFVLLLRRARKLRSLISNFKHSTGVFELALPYSTNVTYYRKYDFQPSIVQWTIEAICSC
ncbi:hypothetical protein E8L09_10450 [Streptococcus suis]|uniref:Uncharacterized protein n=1 Tax=Streptococcus suis TaxID=1307 RepID=A0A4V4RWN4_STRSU|nr:hypothetical protein E8L09_10450 [Streptococcus suis]